MALPFMTVGLFPKASRRLDRACHFSTVEHRPSGRQESSRGPAQACSPSAQRLRITQAGLPGDRRFEGTEKPGRKKLTP